MDKNDRIEVREMITDIIGKPLEQINGQYRVVVNQLSNIEIQTTMTNGRVSDLEDKINDLELTPPHLEATCPHNNEIKALHDNMITTAAIKKAIIQTIASSAAAIAVLYTAYRIFADIVSKL